MTPTASDVHVNRPLTNMSIAYMQSADAFVADRVFPNMPVPKQSDAYFKYDRSDFARNQFRKRAPGTESAGGGWKVAQDTYFAEIWALHKDIPDPIRANTDSPLDLDRDATIWLSQQGLIAREVLWASSYFATGIWRGYDGTLTDITGVASGVGAGEVLHWSDANSSPIQDIKTLATSNMLLTLGLRPNTLVIGRPVLDVLTEHVDVIDRIKYGNSNSSPTIVSRAALAALFDIDRILVMDGVQVTSPENPAFETSITTAFIAGKHALLTYVNPNPSLMSVTSGLTFSWTGYLPGQGRQGQVISRMRLDTLKSDRIEAEMAFTHKAVAADAGIFFNGVIA